MEPPRKHKSSGSQVNTSEEEVELEDGNDLLVKRRRTEFSGSIVQLQQTIEVFDMENNVPDGLPVEDSTVKDPMDVLTTCAVQNSDYLDPSMHDIASPTAPPKQISSSELIQQDIPGSSAVPPELQAEKKNKSPSLGYSFDYTEFLDENEVSSFLIPKASLDSADRLKNILSSIEYSQNMIENAESVRNAILEIESELPAGLLNSIKPVAEIDNQTPRIRRAQKNLSQKSVLMEKKSSNKIKANGLHIALSTLQKTSSSIQPELDTLCARKFALEKELAEINASIQKNKLILAPISVDMVQKKRDLAATVLEGKQITKELKIISESSEDDEKLLAQVESIRTTAVDAIKNFLKL